MLHSARDPIIEPSGRPGGYLNGNADGRWLRPGTFLRQTVVPAHRLIFHFAFRPPTPPDSPLARRIPLKAFFLSLAAVCVIATAGSAAEPLELTLRSQVQPYKGADLWKETTLTEKFNPAECAVVLCDIWDKHWCDSATRRCGELAPKANEVVKKCRERGMFIIHCPSDTMDFYKDSPARQRMKDFTKVEFPKALALPDPPLPIDDKDGGCDDVPAPKSFRAWKRQHPAIVIDEARDGITDNGQEVFNALKARGINTIMVMGVHTNMCVLHRTFAIKQMTRSGMKCVLVRDITDAMYNPASRPNVSHDEGTSLVIRHIEKFWCPTTLSKDLLK